MAQRLNHESALEAMGGCIRSANDYGERQFYQKEAGDEKAIARSNMDRAWLILFGLFESSEFPALLEIAKRQYKEYAKDPDAAIVVYGEPSLKWTHELSQYRNALSSLFGIGHSQSATADSELLKSVLSSSERYLTDPKLWGPPKDEAEVHNRLEAMLRSIFVNVRTKPVVPKSIKNFEPDTGLDDLSTFIEYKYVTSIKDSKDKVDEIFADTSGYKTDPITNIVFVIYETGRFETETTWNTALREADVSDYAEAIVLKGIPAKKRS